MCMGPDGDGAKRITTLPCFACFNFGKPCLVFRFPISCSSSLNCSDCCSLLSLFVSFIILLIC